VGPFYPPGTKAADYLASYAEHFDTVEVDSTYYGVPAATTVERWRDRTPDHFLLSAKFPRAIVHAGKGARPDRSSILVPELTNPVRDAFLETMSRMGEKLGPLVLQFPFLGKDVFPDPQEFLDRLDRFLGDLPRNFHYAVEVRNRDLVNRRVVEMCRRHGAAFTLVDQAWMPHGDEVLRRMDPVTAPFTYIRLLGDHKEMDKLTDTWDREVLDQTPRLTRWARLLADLLSREVPALVYVNNHYAGHAPATVRRLQALVRQALGDREDAAWTPESPAESTGSWGPPGSSPTTKT